MASSRKPLPRPPPTATGWCAWLDERFGWEQLLAPLRHKTVPVHKLSYWYFLGGITLFLFVIQVLTGILLLLYYRPSANEAFESVQYIMTQVKFGWLVRSIHSWSANLMILTAFAHMFSVLFLRAYTKPRELTWLTGMVLLFLALGFGFSGYLLPWNTLAFFATKVGTEITGQVPLIGKPLLIFLRGGEEVTGATLTRFFGFHVALLPGLTTLLIAAHILLIQRLGISVPPEPGSRVEGAAPGQARDAVLPQLLRPRADGLVHRAGRAGRAGCALSVGAGKQGRSLRARARRHQAGVVLHVHVPDPEAHPRQGGPHRWRVVGHPGIRISGTGLGALPFLGGDRYGRRQVFIRAWACSPSPTCCP